MDKNLSINSKDLILNIDLTKDSSWVNDDTLKSINQWEKAKSDDLTLPDYGLTAYDNGRSSNMEECLNLNKNDKHFYLYRVGKNDEDGNIDYSNYEISGGTDENIGDYVKLDGGYYQGFFKLYDYNYEILPARYINGLTIETLINVYDDSEGIFYYMGTRSEDKYNPYFSGETIVRTSENNYLNSLLEEKVLNDAIRIYEEDKYRIDEVSKKQIDNLKNNAISFEITTDKKLKIKKIDNNGDLIELISEKTINTGWNLITIVYKPYTNIDKYDTEKYHCDPDRKGDLIIFVNSDVFWKINNFDEFYFRSIHNNKEKIIGVPYNISWGGGSFGLKHSYHYDIDTIDLYNDNDLDYINDNFSIDGNGTFQYSSDSESMILNINNGTEITINYNDPIDLLGGHEYYMSVYINSNVFNKVIDLGEIYLDIDTNADDYQILNKEIYSTKRINPEWYELKMSFIVDKSCNSYYFYPQIVLKSEIGFVEDSSLKIKDFNVFGSMLKTKDPSKNNLFIEKYFDSSYNGDLQKLRIYNNTLSRNQIINNFKSDFDNEDYNVNIRKGGRIIYKL